MKAGLRALALGLAAGAGVAALSSGPSALAGGLGAALGARLAGPGAQRHRFAALGLAAAFAGLGAVLAAALTAEPRAVERFGASTTLQLAEALRWLSLCGALAFALRALARRSALAGALEIALAGAAFALPLAAHRHGMTHLPLALGDWSGTRGIELELPFLGFGALAAAILAAALVREGERGSLVPPCAAAALIAGTALALLRGIGPAAPETLRSLGLTDRTGDPAAALAGALGGDDAAAPVAVAILHDDYRPPDGVFYFRQAVFSQWNGARLVRASREDVDLDALGEFPGDAPLRARVAPPAEGRRALETTTGLLVAHARPFALDAPLEIAGLANPAPERFVRAFRVRSSAPGLAGAALRGRAAGDPGWSPAQWRHYTQSSPDPRLAALAREIDDALPEAEARDPLARALAIREWLSRNARYSREAPESAASDAPLAAFLFETRRGHCVHFAHAAAQLMRALGLPARVAVGYALPEATRAGGSALLIRSADAHAWAELALAGAGWVPVDPSPRAALEALAPPPDLALQRRLGELLRRPAPAPRPAPPTRIGVGTVGAGLAALLAAAALASGLLGAWRRLAPWLARPRQAPRTAYRAALDRLASLGIARRTGETRERFAARVAGLAPSFDRLTHIHLRAALGGELPADACEPLRIYTTMCRELRSRAPAWRRALGLADPFAWWRAR